MVVFKVALGVVGRQKVVAHGHLHKVGAVGLLLVLWHFHGHFATISCRTLRLCLCHNGLSLALRRSLPVVKGHHLRLRIVKRVGVFHHVQLVGLGRRLRRSVLTVFAVAANAHVERYLLDEERGVEQFANHVYRLGTHEREEHQCAHYEHRR